MKMLAAVFFVFSHSLFAQTAPAPAVVPYPEMWSSLAFLEGPWEAKVSGGEIHSNGIYTFTPALKGHILLRQGGNNPGCKGPADFDCEHSDLLYVYEDAPGAPMKAIYFDNEGHVIHYNVTTPTPTMVVFLSDSSQPGPQFRLTYELKDAVMYGKFQMHMPGSTDWKSYLEWSGGKK